MGLKTRYITAQRDYIQSTRVSVQKTIFFISQRQKWTKNRYLETLHCYKTFRRIPPPWPDGAGPNGQGRGKWLLYMVREFSPSPSEVFRNHRNFPAFFTVKNWRPCSWVGSNLQPWVYWSSPLPLHHGYLVFELQNVKIQRKDIQ